MRSLSIQGWFSRRRGENTPEIIMELDRWQVTALLIAVFVFCAGAFAAGMAMGGRSSDAGISAQPLVVTPRGARIAADKAKEDQTARQLGLASVYPGTDRFDANLSRPPADPHVANPAESARIAAHRAIQEARTTGLREVVEAGAMPHGQPTPVGLIVHAAGPNGDPNLAAGAVPIPAPNIAHALSVATMASEQAATTLRDALTPLVQSPHKAIVRRLVSQGQTLYRVEVGRFKSPSEAAVFLRQFQRDSGYPVDIVDVP